MTLMQYFGWCITHSFQHWTTHITDASIDHIARTVCVVSAVFRTQNMHICQRRTF